MAKKYKQNNRVSGNFKSSQKFLKLLQTPDGGIGGVSDSKCLQDKYRRKFKQFQRLYFVFTSFLLASQIFCKYIITVNLFV